MKAFTYISFTLKSPHCITLTHNITILDYMGCVKDYFEEKDFTEDP